MSELKKIVKSYKGLLKELEDMKVFKLYIYKGNVVIGDDWHACTLHKEDCEQLGMLFNQLAEHL